MASDSPGDGSVTVELPESLSGWLDEKADAEGRSREDVLLQLLSAHRKVDGMENGDVDVPAGMEGLPTAVEEEIAAAVEDRLAERSTDRVDQDELDRVETRFRELLEDVRERVVQVKRETDAKAPADHDHPEMAADLADLEADLDAELSGLATDLSALGERVDAGFDNYEEVLEYLADGVDRMGARQVTLARALVETRDELRKLAARDTARSAAESVKREAAERRIRDADCEACGTAVDVGLLTRAECPHCASAFVGVEGARGFFGSDTLVTGDRPALEDPGGVDDGGFEFAVDELIDDAEDAGAEVRDELDDDSEGDGA